MKKKLKIITLDLGLSTGIDKPEKSPETTAKIDEQMEQLKLEQEIIEKGKRKKQEQTTNVSKAFSLLMQASNEDLEVTPQELMQISGATNISGLMLKIKNKIKKEGAHWVVSKRKSKGITYYSLKPSTELQ